MAVHRSGTVNCEQPSRKKTLHTRSASVLPNKSDTQINPNMKKELSRIRTRGDTENMAVATNEESKRKSRSQSKEQKSKPSLVTNEITSKQNSVRNRRKPKSEKELHGDKNVKVDYHNKDFEDDNLDFTVIEQKIFEGFPLGANSRRGQSSTRGKTKKEIEKKLSASSEKKKSFINPSKENAAHEKKNVANKSSPNPPTTINKKGGKNTLPKSKQSKPKAIDKEKTRTPNKDTRKKSGAKSKKKSSITASDSDMSDWEEVDEMEGVDETVELLSGSHSTQSKPEGVQIELDAPDVLWGVRKRKKRTHEEMIEDYLRKKVNRSIKEVHENMHKVHLLCLFAHGRYVNKLLNSDELLGVALSIITDKNNYPPKRLDINYLEKFVGWFSRKVQVKPEDVEENYWHRPLKKTLALRFEKKKACLDQELVYMFILIFRALGVNARLVLSLQPMSWKPSAENLIKPPKKEEKNVFQAPSCSWDAKSSIDNVKINCSRAKGDNSNKKMLSSDSETEVQRNKSGHAKKTNKKENHIEKRKSLSDDGGDSDFDPNPVKVKKGPKSLTERRRSSNKRRSSEANETTDKGKKCGKDEAMKTKRSKGDPLIEWAEVYVEEEEKWVCVDVIRGKIHCIAHIEARMPAGSGYITAYNANLTVKDVTRRYISSWLSNENKIRCCSKWWEKTLRPFTGQRTRLDKVEDKEMDQNLREQPLPRSIGEYKNHPLYALQRHLLKFEAIYPPDVSPVGFFKNEPVYPRDSIYNLHSRDTWMKEAKSVRVDEEPYKVVKARPKWDRIGCKLIKDLPLELFGEWQVEDYEPPVAAGGKVPRNEYGNVELFKARMLPKGCVHIPIAGLNRVARKLNIDCAPAMVGFDFHSGWTHPVYEGYVICEEFKDILMDAWNEEQKEQARRLEEKRQKRIYDNWKRLIQGILVKERVREKYGTGSQSDEEEEEKIVKEKMEEKKKSTKRKITQEDIAAAKPLITHTIRNLRIDLSSNVVEMARKSRNRTMKTKNCVKRDFTKNKTNKDSMTDLVGTDKESESDNEQKKEKIRAILQWGNKTVMHNPDLSDDSDMENDSQPSSSKSPIKFSDSFYNSKIKTSIRKQGKPKSKSKSVTIESESQNPSDSECETAVSSSRSTTPEPDARKVSKLALRRTSRRSTKKNIKTYKESEQESEGDISIDESDCDDKSYDPKKEMKRADEQVLNLSEGSESS
ncbi:DNA repair protein complementing XP-C cells [Procambarus clarkii]|uniref:DNA repair protein complementing XP-C cells n=1 Tax=Procambarus clarkii TaxID=6728 RepID=UPI001E674D35|nr:DNA repair protein complementing XP-C cells-like [Procambarus clarkii]XP_045603641.1 DNA repair protein complementing XP-C cells-like [Procambarus clarkii]XP_045603642.1 DNA repair protein complementing XP-C cells-like [Procambarus clarkii]